MFKAKEYRDLKDALFLLNYANMTAEVSAKEYFSKFPIGAAIKNFIAWANLDRIKK